MKAKGFKLSSILVVFSAIILALIGFTTNKTAIEAAAADSVTSYYMLLADGATKTSVEAGTTTGYGQLNLLGSKNVALETTANAGFDVVQWLLKVDGENQVLDTNTPEYIHYEAREVSETDFSAKVAEGLYINTGSNFQEVLGTDTFDATATYYIKATITASFRDVDGDALNDVSTLIISEVFDDLQVEPVFDYTYYNLTIDPSISVIDLDDAIQNITEYDVSSNLDGVLRENTIILIDGSYAFFDEVYEVTYDPALSLDPSYYVLQNGKKADISKGAYILGQSVDFGFDIAYGVKVDATGLSLIIDGSKSALTVNTTATSIGDLEDNSVFFSRDEFSVTKDFYGKVNIQESQHLENELEVEYDNLYEVQVNITLDGSVAADDVVDALMNGTANSPAVISFENYFAYIDDFYVPAFYVKKAADNLYNKKFAVSAYDYYETVNGNQYFYYDYISINSDTKNKVEYSTFTEGGVTQVTINYESAKYIVDFEFGIFKNGEITRTNKEIPDVVELARGSSQKMPVDEATVGVIGYTFLGYYDPILTTITQDYTVEIHPTQPINVTVLRVYTKTNYTIQLQNHKSVSINDGSNDIYPLSSVSYEKNGEAAITNTVLTDNLVNLINNINIDDTIVLSQTVNDGFVFNGYFMIKSGDNLTHQITANTFELTESNIATYDSDKNGIIEIYAGVDYVTYTFTYVIDESADATQGVMATLSATYPARLNEDTDIVKTYVDDDETKAITSITIKNIRKYDEVTLTSVGNSETPAGEDPYQYVFVMFTENNGQSSLSKTESAGAYSHTEKVTRDKTIKVVYSTPSAVLSIQFFEENAEGYKANSLEVTVNGTEVAPNAYGQYEIVRTGSVTVSLQVNEGYVFSKYEHVGNGADLEGNTLPYTFTVNTDDVQTLTIYFEAIEYIFNVTQNGGGKVNEVVSKTLSVNNAILSFDKPVGYRVAEFKMYMKNSSNYEDYSRTNSEVVEENGTITSTYSVEFSASEFLNIVKASAVTVDLNTREVNIKVEYEIYTITLRINNKLMNPRGDGYDAQIEFPQVTATSDYADDYTISYVYKKQDQCVLILGIPYGSNVTITPSNTIPLGLKFAGWKDNAGTTLPAGYVTNGTILYIENVTEAKVVRYYLEYIEFDINLTYESVKGDPIVYVDNAIGDTIKTYQTLRIETRPNTNGYKFEKIVYYSIVKYSHDVDSWNELYNQLYINKEGSLVLNESEIHNPAQTYYVKTEVTYTGDTTFALAEQFHLSKVYATEEEGFAIQIVYATREITIVNTSVNFDENTDLIVTGDLNIPTERYAIYSIKAINAEGERDVVAGNTVNVYDTVQITIQINKNAQNGILDEYFDLTKGMILVQDFSAYLPISRIVNNGDGNYVLEFNMSDVMTSIPDTEILKIDYRYIISNKTVTFSTNVNHSVFNSNIELAVTDAENKSASANGSVSYPSHYLTRVAAGYKFTLASGYDQFIKMYDVKIYEKVLVGGVPVSKLVDPANYEAYGIKVVRDQTGAIVTSVQVRYLHDLDVVFIASPVVLLDGKEIKAGETYTFEKIFLCDASGNGLAQNLTIGTKATNNISSVEIVTNAIKVTYKDATGRIVEWGIDPATQKPYGPTNAGVYSVEITFIASHSDYSWLENISIPYTVNYIITPKQVSLTYNVTLAEQQTKPYDGSSSQIVTKWIGSVVFTDNNTFSFAYAKAIENELNQISSFTFDTASYRAYTSYTDNGVEVETATANDEVYYNVTIEGLQLNNTTFNNNFALTNNSVVLLGVMKITRKNITITGLEAYDKVYDTTNVATLNKDTNIIINGVLRTDEVTLNKDALVATFNTADKSTKINDKIITVKADKAIEGAHVANYKVLDVIIEGKTIYPDELEVELENGGIIKLYNEIGLTDPTMANLIPIGAELEVNVIYSDSAEYAKMYGKVSQFLSRTNVFAVGYNLVLSVEDAIVPISKNLHLSVPSVENMTGILFIGGEQSGSMEYTVDEETGNIVVNLGTIEANVTDVVLTQRRALLQLWQIILIVVLSVTAVGTGVAVFIVIRRKKTKQYSANEKI